MCPRSGRSSAACWRQPRSKIHPLSTWLGLFFASGQPSPNLRQTIFPLLPARSWVMQRPATTPVFLITDPNYPQFTPDPQILGAIKSATSASQLLNLEPLYWYSPRPLPVWVEVEEDLYQRRQHEQGILSTNMEFTVQQWRILAKLPIRRGSSFVENSYHLDVLNMISRPQGCRLLVRTTSAFLFFRPEIRNIFCALLNKRRRELIFGRDWNVGSIGGLWGSGLFRLDIFCSLDQFFVLQEIYHDFNHEPSNLQPGSPIDHQWLSEAEIVLIENRLLGRAKKSFTMENFVMNPS